MVIKPNSQDSIQKIIETLKKHKTVIIKCDTIYGIVGKAPETFDAICQIKGRAEHQSFLILIPSKKEIAAYSDAALPEKLQPWWPGPLTIIFPDKAKTGSVALRMPDDPLLIMIMQEANLALYSTSVNLHGEAHLDKIESIIERFDSRVDLIVDSGDLAQGAPSTIIDIRCSPYKLVRQGALNLPGDLFRQGSV